jgi:hypothetical protein
MSLLKGSAWLVNLDFIKQKFGPDALVKVIRSMAAPDREEMQKAMLPSTWGPDFTVFMRFILAADRILGKGDMKLLPEACAYHFKRDTRMYAMLMGFFSTETLLKNLATMWKLYFKPSGEFRVYEIGPKHYQVVITGFENMPMYHDIYHVQYAAEIMRITKCKNIQSPHTFCTARGDQQCVTELTWE